MRYRLWKLFFWGASGWLAACGQRPNAQQAGISATDSVQVFRWFSQAHERQNTDPDAAYALIQKAGALSRRHRFDQGLFNYYNQAIYNRAAFRGDFALAGRLGDTALALVQDPARKRFRMLMNFSRAIGHQLQEENDSAIVYYLRALANQPFTADTSRLPVIQNNLAILFHFQQRDDLAIAYQLKALRHARAQADTGQQIGSYVNLYGFETARKDTAAAVSYLTKGLALATGPTARHEQAELYKNAGEYYLSQYLIDSARYYFNRYHALTKSLYPPAYLAQPLIGLAQANYQAGDLPTAERQLAEVARLTAVDALPMLDRQHYFQTRYQLFKQTRRPAQALAALEKYTIAVAEFDNGKKNGQLVQYHEKVRALQEQKQNTERQYALDRKSSLITALVVGCLLLAVVALLLVLYWRKRKMLESEKLAKLELETEWSTLKSRIEAQQEERGRISQELHDELGTALTSISLASELLKQNQTTNTPEVRIIAKASSEMTIRMNEIVWSLNVNNDNLQSLVAYIRKFCADFLGDAGIQMIFTETIIDPERELKGIVRRNVYQSVKEAVHNVVKHAEASRVELAIATVENELHILIRDNGKGMTDNPGGMWSNGLRNMRRNIESVKGRINWISDNGTQVSIEMPMNA